MIRVLSLVFLIVALTGCLKTRAEIEAERSGQQMERQTQAQQRERAVESRPAESKPAVYREKAPATAYRFEEYDEQMRALSGRIDTLENSLNQVDAARNAEREGMNKNTQILEQKLAAYEEAIKKLDGQVQQLNEEVTRLKTAAPAAPATKLTSPEVPSGGRLRTPYDEGEEHFSAHKWKEAILNYQKYRDTYPKGKLYADSTYKIGVCFQELGMKDEAKSFYEEVTAKFPHSKEAKKAALRMKTLK
jgi:TolA-binding protein